MNKPTTDRDDNTERVPFFSETQKKIYGWYAYTAAMTVCMIGGIIAACFSLVYTDESLPLGGLTLLWRIPMALFWFWFALYAWYKTAEFWDPNDVKWVKDLRDKIFRRR